jgi:hypothetical protein
MASTKFIGFNIINTTYPYLRMTSVASDRSRVSMRSQMLLENVARKSTTK